MKTILLLRHSEPERNGTYPNELIPLSENGKKKMMDFSLRYPVKENKTVYSSPYLRAKETASFFGQPLLDERLIERLLGDHETLNEAFWAKQYRDLSYKNKDGESFLEVQQRMSDCINQILSGMKDQETAVVVSHAAAICAYLFQYCSITVVDPNEKIRKIVYKGTEILCGKIKTPSAFRLTFENSTLTDIMYLE